MLVDATLRTSARQSALILKANQAGIKRDKVSTILKSVKVKKGGVKPPRKVRWLFWFTT